MGPKNSFLRVKVKALHGSGACVKDCIWTKYLAVERNSVVKQPFLRTLTLLQSKFRSHDDDGWQVFVGKVA